MRLLITTPGAVVADEPNVAAVRARGRKRRVRRPAAPRRLRDRAGRVGGRPGAGRTGLSGTAPCAAALLAVSGGGEVAIATREAIPGDDLATLEGLVRGRLAAEAEAQHQASSGAEQLRLQAIRQIVGYLRPASGEGNGRP
ncbi:MAG: hypothetical protein WDM92_03605 [Caulobacteraceae bacterium]